MANETMVLLEKIVVPSAGASSITFTSIPQSYTDLVVKLSTRTNQGSGPDYVYLQFNGNTSTSNYQGIFLRGNGSTVASSSNTAEGKIRAAITTTSGETASTFSNCEIYIPNYTSSNNKSTSSDWVPENNATATFMGITAGLWTQTSAITSINLALSSGSFVQYSTFYLYGVAKQGVTPTNAPAATGGDRILFDGTYWYHVFTSTGTFTPKKALSSDILVVAGGAGGARSPGGAGGLCYQTGRSVTASTNYTVTIGAGSVGVSYPSNCANGSNSVFDTITALGGGGGVSEATAGQSGGSGSGGAGSGSTFAGGAATQGNSGGATGYGFAGGSGGNYYNSGGGGGAGGVGGDSINGSTNKGGAGGVGRTDSTLNAFGSATSTGQLSSGNYYYAGGGGGYSQTAGTGGAGGLGGGGNGYGQSTAGTAGSANTGGGGGGYGTPAGYNGGSGIVIVRYAA